MVAFIKLCKVELFTEEYRDICGEIGLPEFRNQLEIATRTGHAVEQTILNDLMPRLIDIAGDLSVQEISHFWTSVSPLAIQFQQFYKSLEKLQSLQLGPNVGYHINTEEGIGGLTELKPLSLLRPWEITPDVKEDASRVCFASGSLSSLSKFLVGHQLLDSFNLYSHSTPYYKHSSSLEFAKRFSLVSAPLNTPGLNISADPEHMLESPLDANCYFKEDTINVWESESPIAVHHVALPLTLLTAPQQNALIAEGKEYHANYVKTGKVQLDTCLVEHAEQNVAEAFAYQRHLELTITFAILNDLGFDFQNPSSQMLRHF